MAPSRHLNVFLGLVLWPYALEAQASGSDTCPYGPSSGLSEWIGDVEGALDEAAGGLGPGSDALAEDGGENGSSVSGGSSGASRSSGGSSSGGSGSSSSGGDLIASAGSSTTSASGSNTAYSSASNLSPEEQAALATIRYAEGADYDRLFGYFEDPSRVFDPYTQVGHPDSVYSSSGYTSAAAGAYQAMPDTWNEEVAKGTITNDFTPENQDQFALARLEYRGLLDEVQSGDTSWITSLEMGREWASFPNSPYGQRTHSAADLRAYYEQQLAYYRSQ